MKSVPILLDTCAAIWVVHDAAISAEAEQALTEASAEQVALVVSPMTAWEVGMLVSKGRIALSEEPRSWFSGLLESGVKLAELTPEILIASSFLPSCPLRDPADRIMAALARAYGYRLMTRDRPLLEYAAAGHLRAIAC